MDTGVVVGRNTELEEIARWLDDPKQPVLLIEGEAGIGKTTLWRSGVDEASERGHRVLAYGAVQAEAQLSFTAVRDLVGDTYDEVVEKLPAPQRQTLGVVLLREPPGAVPPDPGSIGVSLLTTFRAVAARAPIVIAIDDAQWLDSASASALAYVLRRVTDTAGISVLVAYRTNGASSERPLGLDQLDASAVGSVRVAGLTLGATGQFLRARLGFAYPRPTLRLIHQISGGNPFFTVELARALGSAPAPLDAGAPLPVAATLHELVDGRLMALPSETFDALVVASALARPTLELVGAALERDPVALLEPSIAAQIAALDETAIRFAHPLYVAAVGDLAGPARLGRVHRRLAELVTDQEERARHLALGADGPSEEVAHALDEAARLAASRGAPAEAAQLEALAVQLTPAADNGRLVERRIDVARYHLIAGEMGLAAAILEPLVEELPVGSARADALVQLADAAQEPPGFERSRQHLERALVEARGDDTRIARIEEVLSRYFNAANLHDEAMQHAWAGLEAAERAGDDQALALALATVASRETVSAVEPTPGLLERAVALEDSGLTLEPYPSPSRRLAQRLMSAGRLDEARDRLERLIAVAVEVGEEVIQGMLLVDLTELECRAGRWQLAARHAADGYELVEPYGFEHPVCALLYARTLVDAHLGRVEHTRALAEQGIALSEECGAELDRLLTLAALGFLELSLGDVAAADQILRPLAARLATSIWREPGMFGELPNGIEALVELGELEEARRLLADLEDRVSRIESPWGEASTGRCDGLILSAEGDLEGALATYERALEVHARLPQPFDHGRTLLALGVTQRRARQRKAARETLERALAIFEELGAALWAKKARSELARIGGRAASGGDLTPAEQRVAKLVAEGHSNKQVAAELVLSEHTVESTLRSIYRKLDVHSRTEMARKLSTTA